MPSKSAVDSPFLTAEEAARFLHTTPGSLRQAVIPKRIPHRRSGHKLLFVLSELDAWLKAQTRIELRRLADRRRRQHQRARRKQKPAA